MEIQMTVILNSKDFALYTNPLHCPSGTCVDDIVKCSTSFKIPSCSEGEFYCARLNQCLKKELDCFIFYKEVLFKWWRFYKTLKKKIKRIKIFFL